MSIKVYLCMKVSSKIKNNKTRVSVRKGDSRSCWYLCSSEKSCHLRLPAVEMMCTKRKLELVGVLITKMRNDSIKHKFEDITYCMEQSPIHQ